MINFNSTQIQSVKYNNQNINKVICNGTEVFNYDDYFSGGSLSDTTSYIQAKDVNNLPPNLRLPSAYLNKTVTTVANEGFKGSQIQTLEIPDSITVAGQFAFQNCAKLSSVSMGTGLKVLYNSLFQGCTKLEQINLSNVTQLGNNVFEGCFNLLKIDLSTVTAIGAAALGNCQKLEEVILSDNLPVLNEYLFSGCYKLSKITLPSQLTQIKPFVFNACKSLTSIRIPSKVTSIQTSAFANCTSLQTIVLLPTTPPSLSSTALTNVPLNCTIYVPAQSVELYKTADFWDARKDYIAPLP